MIIRDKKPLTEKELLELQNSIKNYMICKKENNEGNKKSNSLF